MKKKISFDALREYLKAPICDFPKYSTQLLNVANQNAQATRPKVVGQLSELIQQFPGNTLGEWEEWYLKQYPESIDIATEKIEEMIEHFRDSLDQLSKDTIRKWVRDLVIVKTFVGLRFQEAVLKEGAKLLNVKYRLSNKQEESKGIDGFIGEIAVSIKPETYESMQNLQEKVGARMIYYTKTKDGIEVDYTELLDSR